MKYCSRLQEFSYLHINITGDNMAKTLTFLSIYPIPWQVSKAGVSYETKIFFFLLFLLFLPQPCRSLYGVAISRNLLSIHIRTHRLNPSAW
jgi:hypothetical protein